MVLLQAHQLLTTYSIWWLENAKNDQEQTSLLTIIKGFSDDIKAEFGLEKCIKATFKTGQLTTTENIQIDTNIQDLEQEGKYKYLGVN